MDPDFGWHLRMGQIILSSGIPQTDPLSYTMSSYPFIDHEWLSNIIFAFLYKTTYLWILSALFATVATFAIVIPLKKAVFGWKIVLTLWATVILIQYSGIRPQVFDWVFISLLLGTLLDNKIFSKFKFLLPFLVLLWVNLHGGFVIGVGIIVFWAGLKLLKEKRLDKPTWIVVIGCLVATLINPYGPRIWHEIFQQFTDTTLRHTIDEWEPFFSRYSWEVQLAPTLFMVFATFLLAIYRKKFDIFTLGIFVIFLFTAVTTKREVPVWLVVSLPLSAIAAENLKLSIKGKNLGYFMAAIFILTFGIFFYRTYLILISVHDSSEDFRYPKQLIQNTSTIKIEGNVFAEYSWGGYLDWKLPDKKVFIDGRMPSWRWDHAPKEQSDYAFGEYRNVVDTGDFKKTFQKYNIGTVIWPTGLFQSDNNTQGPQILSRSIITNQPLLVALQKSGWKLVYGDYITMVFEKP